MTARSGPVASRAPAILSAVPGASAPLAEDVERILRHVGPLPAPRPNPALVVLVGLPGAGKSWLATELRRRTGAVALESDDLRALLFGRPAYSVEESRRLFAAIHAAIEEILRRGAPVILDATNLAESEREPLYAIAEAAGARLVIVRVVAPRWLIHRRLARRTLGIEPSRSEAGVLVYERMRRRFEPIRRPHFRVDTSRDTAAVVDAIVREMEGRNA
jgi:predicted kinase